MKVLVLLLLSSTAIAQQRAAPVRRTTKPPARVARRPASKTAVTRAPAALPPLPAPADRTLPKGIALIPGAKAEKILPNNTKDNRHFLVGSFIANATFNQAVSFYRPRVQKIPPMKLNVFGAYKTTQGWLKGVKRGPYSFRVHLINPVVDATGKPNPKLTRVQYFMETN